MTKCAGEDFQCNRLTKRRPPGFLLSPFGWAAERLALMIESEPSCAADLFRLSRKRMHLIALAEHVSMAKNRYGWDRRPSVNSCCAARPKKYSMPASVAIRLALHARLAVFRLE